MTEHELIDYGVSVGWLTPEKAEELKKEFPVLVRCKDCDNKECWGRAGNVVCGIDGTPHRPDWFCADGERKDGEPK